MRPIRVPSVHQPFTRFWDRSHQLSFSWRSGRPDPLEAQFAGAWYASTRPKTNRRCEHQAYEFASAIHNSVARLDGVNEWPDVTEAPRHQPDRISGHGGPTSRREYSVDVTAQQPTRQRGPDSEAKLSEASFPVVAALLAEARQSDGTTIKDVHQRKAAVLHARSFDHRDQRAIVDAVNILEVVLVAMALEDC